MIDKESMIEGYYLFVFYNYKTIFLKDVVVLYSVFSIDCRITLLVKLCFLYCGFFHCNVLFVSVHVIFCLLLHYYHVFIW